MHIPVSKLSPITAAAQTARSSILSVAGVLISVISLNLASAAQPHESGTPFACRAEAGAAQLKCEAVYDSKLDAKNMESWMKRMTARPHPAGSLQTRENAEYIAGLFTSWGYEVKTEIFHFLNPTPKTRELQLLRPYPITLELTEKIIESDSAAETLRAGARPPYNAHSGEGEVVGPLVYINRGLPEDYKLLEQYGIDVKGCIVIARYGGSWRGIKPKVAREHGAIGCIIFNDPGDDGYTQGAAYPDGAFKYAPGRYTGYGVKTLPGVREGIETREWDETEREIIESSTALKRCASAIRRARDHLTGETSSQ